MEGCAAASAARNGVFAAVMAQAGIGRPADAVFEDGLTARDRRRGGPLLPFRSIRCTSACRRRTTSSFSANSTPRVRRSWRSELRPQIKLDDIEKVEVFTYHFAWLEIGSGPEKWKPTTRARPPTAACLTWSARC